ncbi:Bax inhibitor-1/YccA family protein [Bacillus luti]|nr:Bax inhibitor-1/YccA family protein [Bacillus cereus]HDR8328624.1 Bax inhibitor-1/YccA family protein [Bacillus cereus]HDR8334260.1 Bax inhibitor-1/YccA family protein [Bacillus cereus]
MKSSNPLLNEDRFNTSSTSETPMSLSGTISKIALLFIMLLSTSVFAYTQTVAGKMQNKTMTIFLIISFILILITTFFPKISPFTALIYAGCEGVVIGTITAFYGAMFNGIVFQAILITISIFTVMLILYSTRLIQTTEKFKSIVLVATLGIAVVYLISFALSFANIQIPFIHESGWIGIGFSLFVVIIAALNLILDFDSIEAGVNYGAPKYMEWYTGLGLLVTLVWLYLDILRLLSKIASRD